MALLVVTFVGFMLSGDIIDTIHGKMFGLTSHELNVIIDCWLGLCKSFVILFFLFPWIAIRLVLRKAGR